MGGFIPSDMCAVAMTPPLAGCLATREMQFSDSATVLRLQNKKKRPGNYSRAAARRRNLGTLSLRLCACLVM